MTTRKGINVSILIGGRRNRVEVVEVYEMQDFVQNYTLTYLYTIGVYEIP